MGFLAIIVLGLVAGLLARVIVPGRSGMGIPATILLGIAGSFVGGFLGSLLYTHRSVGELELSGLLFSTIGAIVVLVVVNRLGFASRAK
ncbi:MAG: GlsB/YeaQ/YmgE family stress response membrane protein [Archangiaceae bacterium]|nr:GlsB/YeaQ/YmgE family stress response membrane protein [Archangiaceae bacterium]